MTVTVTVRDTVRPFFGTSTTRRVHRPRRTPRTDDPTNRHTVRPAEMEMRIDPCDLRGMASPAAAAIRVALKLFVRRRLSTRAVTVVAVFDDDATVTVVVGGAVVGGAVVAGAVVGGAVVTGATTGDRWERIYRRAYADCRAS